MGLLFLGLSILLKANKKTIVLSVVALFFLLAAMGDFAFLRAWLYHYVPMMNVFRYPSLFRLFALLCFLLLFGIGIENFWKKDVKIQDWKKLKMLAGTLLFGLVSVFMYSFFKSDFVFPSEFSAKAISAFIAKSSNSQLVLIQAPIQIALLLLLFFVIEKRRTNFRKYITLIILLDLFLAVQLNLLITAVSDQKAAVLQEKISELPDGFPIPNENISATTHYGKGDFYPIWYNNNMLEKKIAYDGYNNFKLKNYKQFDNTPGYIEKLKYPLIHWTGSRDSLFDHRSNNVQISSFTPTKIKAKIAHVDDGEIVFLQSDYPGWKVKLNGEIMPHYTKEDIFIAANIPKGKHEIEFEFHPKNFWWYFGISTIAFVCALFVMLWFRET